MFLVDDEDVGAANPGVAVDEFAWLGGVGFPDGAVLAGEETWVRGWASAETVDEEFHG